MGDIYGIENYSERYSEYGSKILKETETSLKKAGINIFPLNYKKDDNTDSCVIVNNKSSEEPKKEKEKKEENPENKKELQWIRASLPTSNNIMSIHSMVNKKVSEALANKALINGQNNPESSQSSNDYDNSYGSHDVFNAESDVSNVSTVSNASDDESNDPLLNFFQKEIKNEGFSSSNFLGANYEIDNSSNLISRNVSTYSDNMFYKKNTSIIFGGTLNADYNPSGGEEGKKRIDYNAYAFGKHKASKITFGAGALGTQKDGVSNLTIDVGVMHNETGIYGIIKKDITFVPGLPTQTHTDINIGIGESSGYLDFEEYHSEDKSVQEISDIDNVAEKVKNQESGVFDDIDTDDTSKLDNTILNLVILDTNQKKEYGFKGGYICKFTGNDSRAFVLPYGQITNVIETSDDGTNKEGARLIAGVNGGQKATYGSGWELTAKGLIEASRTIMTGSRPSDYILANVCFKANKNNFSGEASTGGFYTNSSTYSKYAEIKLGYSVNDKFSVNLNGGYANSKFGNSNNELYQFAGGVSYKF